MFELVVSNKDWLFSGIGVAVILGIVNFIFNSIKKKRSTPETKSAPIKNQVALGNSVNIQGSGNSEISVGSINVIGKRISEKLSKPYFSIKQVGLTAVWGQDPEYRLQISNEGGHSYSIEVGLDFSQQQFKITEMRRGGSAFISVATPHGTGSIMIIIAGLDGNGDEFKQVIHGTNYRDGYRFLEN